MDDFLLKQYLNAGNITVNQQILSNYHKTGMTNDQLLLYLQILSFQEEGIKQPSTSQLAQRLHWDENIISSLLVDLKEKKLMVIDSVTDVYDFTGFLKKIIGLIDSQEITKNQSDPSNAQINSRDRIIQKIQVEFGRPLSPTEMQTIISWFNQDKFDPQLIELAVKEAVLNDVRNLRYIDSILANWQKNNVSTVQQAQVAKANYQQKKRPANSSRSRTDLKIPLTSIEDMND